METIETLDPTPFKHLVMSIGALPTSFVDSMSYYECIAWLVAYIRDNVVPACNNNAEAIKEIQEWIETLDLQDEVDHKLDEMKESGELAEIISQYLNSTAIFAYDSVAAMKAAENLIAGSYARTTGYYNANDGGGALYKIRNVTNDDTIDEAFIVEMGDGSDELVAELIIDNNEVNIKQLGGRSQAKDDTRYDIAGIITKYVNYRIANSGALRLYIPSGVYHSSPLTIISSVGIDIKGDFQFNLHTETGTIISTLNDNQDYIWTFGDNSGATQSSNLHLSGLMFTTAEYEYNSTNKKFQESSIKTVNNYCLKAVKTQFSKLEDIAFQHINGTGLVYRECWEISNIRLNFRDIYNPSGCAFLFENKITGGSNTMYFDWIQFEQIIGHCISAENNASVQQIHFDNITFEDYIVSRTGVVYTNFPSGSYSEDTATHFAIINTESGDLKAITIDSLMLNNMGVHFSTINGNNYSFDTIINMNRDGIYTDITIGTICVVGQQKDNFIARGNGYTGFYDKSKITINNFSNATQTKDWLWDIVRFPHIVCNANLKGVITTVTNLLAGNNGAEPCGTIAAYKLVPLRVVNDSPSFITGDKEVINGANAAVEISVQSNSIQFIATKNSDGFIRAKIANGETFKLYVGSVTGISPAYGKSFELVGTGSYKIYPLDFSSIGNWHLGDTLYMIKGNNSEANTIYIDVISM